MWDRFMPKIVVIANCQCLPIARTIALGLLDSSVEFIDVNFVTHEPHKTRIERLVSEPADIVFSIPLSDQWKGISTDFLRPIYHDRLFTFTNIHFEGLHPDITYIGEMGVRVQGALSDYHSKLILYGFATGRSITDTIRLFHETDYQAIGFGKAFQQSSVGLIERDVACDVQFAPCFIEIIKNRSSMYSVNHPMDHVFRALAEKLCTRADLHYKVYPDEYLTNYLSDNVIWPVYDKIAEMHNLPYRTPQYFVKRNEFSGRTIRLDELVSQFYCAYQSVSNEKLLSTIKAMQFFTPFTAAIA